MVQKEQIDDIKQSVNIVDVIGEYISLTKAGRNFLGLCPFHGEKTPSFNVVEDKQFYHCFGCGRSGDVFKFIEEYQQVPFMESVRIVAEKAGIAVELPQLNSQRPQRQQQHQALYDVHEEAAKFYHALLMTTKLGEEARRYLHQRGLTDEVIRTFQIGLAPDEPNFLYRSVKDKFAEADLLASGLFNPTENNLIYDAFQNRIIFPLTDEKGQVIAFSGRIWQATDMANKPAGKYKNSRSTAIFNKSYELYHLDKAKAVIKKQQEVYLMEGFMDVIAAHRAGIDNAVASMGTALTPEHVQHLSRFCKKVVLVYDGDKAGQAATEKALAELGKFDVDIVSLPEGLDPDEYISRYSAEGLAKVLTQSRISQVEFFIDYWQPDNPENAQQQIAFVEKIAPLIAQTKSLTAQNAYINKVADGLSEFSYQQVEYLVNQARLQVRGERREATYQQQAQRDIQVMQHPRISSLVRAENQILYRLQEHAYLLNEFRLRPDFSFATPELQRLFTLLKQNGEITSYDVAQEEESVQRAYYQMMEERLPEDMPSHEMAELEASRDRELLKRDNRIKSRSIREHSHVGDDRAALDGLAQLIAQKRKME